MLGNVVLVIATLTLLGTLLAVQTLLEGLQLTVRRSRSRSRGHWAGIVRSG